MGKPQTIPEILTVLAAAYPRFELTPPTIRIYEQMVSDIPIDALHAAILDLIGESRFFPTVAEIRERAFTLMAEQEGTPDAYEAWELTLRYVRQGRGHPIVAQSQDWDIPPLIERAARQVGGWVYLAQADNVAADRARFLEAYERALEKQDYIARRLPQITALADAMSLPFARELTVSEEVE